MASPAIHRTHSVRNWVYLDDINDVVRQLTPVLEMARKDHAANSDDDSAFSPAITTKDDRPVLIWHHTHTSNSHQGTLFIPPEVGGPENAENEGEGSAALIFVHSARRSGKNTARRVEATNRANAMEASLRRAVELHENAVKGTYNHQQAKEAVIIEAGVIPNRIGTRHGLTVIGVNDTLGYRSPTTQELVDMYREHGLQHTGEGLDRILTSDLAIPLLRHFENGCRCMEGGASQ